ncbi:hypothetical protein ACJX0J_008545, partial [Zea mays]
IDNKLIKNTHKYNYILINFNRVKNCFYNDRYQFYINIDDQVTSHKIISHFYFVDQVIVMYLIIRRAYKDKKH